MKCEVDKLIRNLLSARRPVSMPGVGTLETVRHAAARLPHSRMAPPAMGVEFSSAEREPSLVEAIRSAASCTPEQAHEIYDRWLERSREGDVLVIGGVGRLAGKSFTLDAAFDAALNPLGHQPVRMKRRRDGWLWGLAGAAVCVAIFSSLAVIGVIGPFPYGVAVDCNTSEKREAQSAETASVPDMQTAVLPAEAEPEPEALQSTATPDVRLPETAPTVSDAERSVSTSPQDAIVRTQSGRHYVVLGVYTTEQNARRAVAQVRKKDAVPDCRIYLYGDKFMVSLFESDDAARTAGFARAHRGAFRDLWVYTKR